MSRSSADGLSGKSSSGLSTNSGSIVDEDSASESDSGQGQAAPTAQVGAPVQPAGLAEPPQASEDEDEMEDDISEYVCASAACHPTCGIAATGHPCPRTAYERAAY